MNTTENKTSSFTQSEINPVAQLANNISEGIEGFDRLVMKMLLAYELEESFYFIDNSEKDMSPFITTLMKISNQPLYNGYNMSLITLTREIATCEQEHAQLQLLVNCWNDIRAYADQYGLDWQRAHTYIRELSQDQIYTIVKYLYSV